MIITEKREINGCEFIYTYSNENMMIMRDGVLYSEAYDPVGINRIYFETLTPIRNVDKEEEFIKRKFN